ncbi:MAG TPA: amidohydrolase family protein, partial [Chloroflexota bacterium]
MRAIDIHVHPTDERIARAWAGDPADAEHFFRGSWTTEDLDATAERFLKLDTLAVLLGADAETTTGVPAYPNDLLAAACKKYPDRFIGFAGIDPWKGALAIRELERSVKQLGLKGAKFHPGRQEFYPN